MQVIDTGNSNILGFVRSHIGQRVIIMANFSEREQVVPANLLRLYGLGYMFVDLLSGDKLAAQDITLAPLDFRALGT